MLVLVIPLPTPSSCIRDALGEINLGAYADLLVVEFGYILDDIKDMDAEELKAVAADAEMRRGEELRFLKRFGQPQAKKESIVVRLVNAGYPRQLACRAMVDLKIPVPQPSHWLRA